MSLEDPPTNLLPGEYFNHNIKLSIGAFTLKVLKSKLINLNIILLKLFSIEFSISNTLERFLPVLKLNIY